MPRVLAGACVVPIEQGPCAPDEDQHQRKRLHGNQGEV
jgi:hypothetical protein